MAKLEKDDLKIMRDKNVIKLFKLGQLTTEYLMYQKNYTDGISGQIETKYFEQFDRTKKIEDEVKEN